MSDVLYELPLPWPLNAHTSNTLFIRNWAYNPLEKVWKSYDLGYQCSNVQAGSPFTGLGWTDFNNLLEVLYLDLQSRMFLNPRLVPSIAQPAQFINGNGTFVNGTGTVTGMQIDLINVVPGLVAESGPPILYQAGKWGWIGKTFGGSGIVMQSGFNYINWDHQEQEAPGLIQGVWWHLEPGVNAFLTVAILDPQVKLQFSTDGGGTYQDYIGSV